MMSPGDLFGTAFGAIHAHPMRSTLTTLGVIIGVAAVVAMTSIGKGVETSITNSIQGLGSNLLVIMPGNFRAGGVNQGAGSRASITDDDVAALQQKLPDAAVVAAAVRTRSQLVYEGANWNTQVEGSTSGYLEARDWSMAQGRFFDEREARQGKKVVVIGKTVADQLFPDGDAIGARLRVGTTPFEVIGVLESKGQSAMGMDQDDIVVGPLNAVRSRVKGRGARIGAVDQIYLKARSADQVSQLEEDATAVMRQRHRIGEGDTDDFSVRNMASMLSTVQSTTQTFTLFLAAIAAVSLLVGGIGIMNIMLVAVTERTREIGLRMALGARRGDILRQFTIESVVLSFAGGVVGLTLGVLIAFVVSLIAKWPMTVPLDWAIIALSVSAFIGLAFGAYPAYRAAQLDPIEALRRD